MCVAVCVAVCVAKRLLLQATCVCVCVCACVRVFPHDFSCKLTVCVCVCVYVCVCGWVCVHVCADMSGRDCKPIPPGCVCECLCGSGGSFCACVGDCICHVCLRVFTCVSVTLHRGTGLCEYVCVTVSVRVCGCVSMCV